VTIVPLFIDLNGLPDFHPPLPAFRRIPTPSLVPLRSQFPWPARLHSPLLVFQRCVADLWVFPWSAVGSWSCSLPSPQGRDSELSYHKGFEYCRTGNPTRAAYEMVDMRHFPR
jgi:hypothetical protein